MKRRNFIKAAVGALAITASGMRLAESSVTVAEKPFDAVKALNGPPYMNVEAGIINSYYFQPPSARAFTLPPKADTLPNP